MKEKRPAAYVVAAQRRKIVAAFILGNSIEAISNAWKFEEEVIEDVIRKAVQDQVP